jgi:hypothetical protein
VKGLERSAESWAGREKVMLKGCIIVVFACCLVAGSQGTKGAEQNMPAQKESPAKTAPEDWRKAEEKFCKFIGSPEIPDGLDKPPVPPPPGLRGYSFIHKNSGKPIAEIEKACGAPTRIVTDKKTGEKIFFYGRVGYTTKDGKTMDQMTLVVSIAMLDEYEK